MDKLLFERNGRSWIDESEKTSQGYFKVPFDVVYNEKMIAFADRRVPSCLILKFQPLGFRL